MKQEPFGYFKAEPFGWTDCAPTDEGAIALYERPAQQPDDARDARRWRHAMDSETFAVCQWETLFGEPMWVPISETSTIDAALSAQEQTATDAKGGDRG